MSVCVCACMHGCVGGYMYVCAHVCVGIHAAGM